jgi:uncharacterized protein YecE (DUF72 family)
MIFMGASEMKAGRLWVGTSGWSYPDWKWSVYPAELRALELLDYYSEHFDTVELNATFYHFPRESTVEKWRSMAGGREFTWSVKAWRWLTHVKRLKGVRRDARDFLERVRPLASSGIVLFQLPPSFKKGLKRLGNFLKTLPSGFRRAVEFRHNSWFDEETYDLLRAHDTALVGVDAPGITQVLDVQTASFSYFRFHGSSHWYFHDYTPAELRRFAQAARQRLAHGDVFAYFDNTAEGHAFHNALSFKGLVLADRE